MRVKMVLNRVTIRINKIAVFINELIIWLELYVLAVILVLMVFQCTYSLLVNIHCILCHGVCVRECCLGSSLEILHLGAKIYWSVSIVRNIFDLSHLLHFNFLPFRLDLRAIIVADGLVCA